MEGRLLATFVFRNEDGDVRVSVDGAPFTRLHDDAHLITFGSYIRASGGTGGAPQNEDFKR